MKLHRFFIIFLSLLLITCDMRADGGDVLERIIRLPGTKGTVYSLLTISRSHTSRADQSMSQEYLLLILTQNTNRLSLSTCLSSSRQ